MFFDRSGRKSNSTSPVTPEQQEPRVGRGRPQPGSRPWAALGLAAAMAAPFGVVQISQIYAEDVKPEQLAGPRPSDADLVRQATDEFRLRQFEQAEKTLAAVKVTALSDAERDACLSLATDVKHAATECRAAREQLLTGEDALKAQQESEAINHFKAVALNKFADEATVKKAQVRLASMNKAAEKHTQVALASDPQPAVATASQGGDLSPHQRYELGLSQYRSGSWNEARKNLEIARAAGYTPDSIYQDSPAEILNRISARDQAVQERQRVQKLTQTPETQPSNGNDPLAALRATDDAERIRRQQAQAQAQQLVQDAQAAERNNDFNRAQELYSRAIDLDPNNAAAIQGRDQSMRLMGRNPAAAAPAGGGNLPDQAAADVRARQGEIRYQIQSNLDQARAATQSQNWANAQTAIDRARLAAGLDPTIFSPDEIRNFRAQIDQADLALRSAQDQARQTSERQTSEAIERKIQQEREVALRDRQNTIADLIRTSRNLTDQGKYREALQTVDQILVLDPNNDYAVGVKPLLEDKVQFAQQRQYMEQQKRGVGEQLIRAEEQLIPYNDILRYPTDWPDISQTRDQTVAQERSTGRSDALTVAQLEKPLPALTFDAVGFSDVVDFLRDVSGTNIFVNWKSLEAAGIDRNTPVSANLRNIKFSKALSIILDSVGGGQTKLGYTIDEGVITISTQDDLSRNVVVRVYDIRDLIVNIPDFTDAPTFSLDASQNSGNSGGGGQGIGQGGGGQTTSVTNQLFQNANQLGQNQNRGPTRQDLIDNITKLIEDTVSTDSWKDNGGSVGALRELEGQLIVTQTPENHRQLVNLLEQLREERAIQVTVETRFLTVQRNFLEDVGVDLNFLFNLNNSWSSKFGTIPVTTPNSAFTANPSTGVPGSLGGGSTTPTGLTTSATYLDDFQVQLVMRAVQASITSTVVTAPRITLFNGQRAYVLVATQRSYVSNLVPIVSTGVSSFSPVPALAQSGVVLDVQATVSADRKYVTLTLRPTLSTLLDLINFTFQTGATQGAVSGGGIGSTVAVAPTGTVQQPELQTTQVRTTVSVPDGGTLLIGGQTLAGEIEREIGVPVLSKIPVLKRLFTNKSMAKDEQILLIMVRPTIIMQREIEQKQFPLLSSKLSNS